MTAKRARAHKTINQLIGGCIRRHRETLRLTGTALGERLEVYLGEPWTRQTVYEAESGRRAFRASDLIALAMALDVQVGELVDAVAAKERQVEIAPNWNLGAQHLLDLFRMPGEAKGPSFRALVLNREVLDDLEGAIAAAKRVNQNLSRMHPEFPAYEGGEA